MSNFKSLPLSFNTPNYKSFPNNVNAVTKNENGLAIIDGGIALGNSVTIDITGDVNNLVIPDIDKVSILNFNCTVNSQITGITNPSPLINREFKIFNVGTANLTLKDLSPFSLDKHKFDISGDILMQPKEGGIINYDNDLSFLKWKSPAKNT